MKNAILKYRWALLAYVLVVALFFAAGYGAGVINGQNRAKEDIALATERPAAVNASISTEETVPEYELILEEGRLTIYENSEDERSIIARCEISESVYPPEDISALRKGMVFAEKTDAMAMFENFAS